MEERIDFINKEIERLNGLFGKVNEQHLRNKIDRLKSEQLNIKQRIKIREEQPINDLYRNIRRIDKQIEELPKTGDYTELNKLYAEKNFFLQKLNKLSTPENGLANNAAGFINTNVLGPIFAAQSGWAIGRELGQTPLMTDPNMTYDQFYTNALQQAFFKNNGR